MLGILVPGLAGSGACLQLLSQSNWIVYFPTSSDPQMIPQHAVRVRSRACTHSIFKDDGLEKCPVASSTHFAWTIQKKAPRLQRFVTDAGTKTGFLIEQALWAAWRILA